MEKNNNSTYKLLLLCQLFYPELVSTGQTLTELCEVLADKGVEIEVVCAPPSVMNSGKKVKRRMVHHDIHIKRVWATSFPKLNFLGRVINQLTYALSVFLFLLFKRNKGPILVLTNPPFLAFFCALLRKLKLGSPYIYLIFDVYPDTAVNLGVIKKNSLLSRLWEWVNKISFMHASKIIVIGRCMKDIIETKIKKYGIQRTDNTVHMIHVWSDDQHIQTNKNEKNPFNVRWGLAGKFIVLYSGNMGRFHDMETIMEAISELSDFKNIVFLFVGEGHKKAWIMDYAKRNNHSNCQFHSYVKREELPDLLSIADVGIVSLLEGQEGLSVPSKAYALMAAGVPVVAIIPSLSEIARMVTEENCGMVVRNGDVQGLKNAILTFYNNRDLLKRLANNASKSIAEKYSLESAANSYYRIIKDLNLKISQEAQ